jgi:hypothetical protein
MRGENKQFLKSALLAGDWQKFRNQSKRRRRRLQGIRTNKSEF